MAFAIQVHAVAGPKECPSLDKMLSMCRKSKLIQRSIAVATILVAPDVRKVSARSGLPTTISCAW